MSLIRRRGLLAGLGAMLAAPAIIRTAGLLMPVKPALNSLAGRTLMLSEVLYGDKPVVIWMGNPSELGVFEERFIAMFQGHPLYGSLIG